MTFAYNLRQLRRPKRPLFFEQDGLSQRRHGIGSRFFYQLPDPRLRALDHARNHAEIPPGQTIVQLYYPQLPSKVTHVSSPTTATLETKIRWADKSANERRNFALERQLRASTRSNIQICRPVKFSPGTMFLFFSFAVAMVTPNDPW